MIFRGVACSHSQVTEHFNSLQAIFKRLGLQEAVHKALHLAQTNIWLGFEFNSVDMTITIPSDKLKDIMSVVRSWSNKAQANIHELRSLLG